MKRILKCALICFLGVVVGLGIGLQRSFTLNKTRAIETAERYLQKEYRQEMQFRGIEWFLDPGYFYVSFSPSNDPKIVFEVVVHGGLRVDNPTEVSRGDNYYSAWFEHGVENYFVEEVHRLWGANAEILVSVNNSTETGFWIDKEINDAMPLSDVANLFGDYHIYVGSDNMMEDAGTMLDFVQFVKQNSFLPTSIIFANAVDDQQVELTDLRELVSVEQIQDVIAGQVKQ